jgi:uncharacterized phiE125 gp8 family phage protein
MRFKLITPPATEPITLAEAKEVCRVDGTEEDLLLQALISAAREQCEHILGRSLMPQTWEAVLDEFPANANIALFHGPVASIESVKYISAATANEATVPDTDYYLDADNLPAFVLPAYEKEWPQPLPTANAVRVRYVAGYADSAAVPANIKAWIKIAVATLYKHREAVIEGTTTELPKGFYGGLLDRYRAWQ